MKSFEFTVARMWARSAVESLFAGAGAGSGSSAGVRTLRVAVALGTPAITAAFLVEMSAWVRAV